MNINGRLPEKEEAVRDFRNLILSVFFEPETRKANLVPLTAEGTLQSEIEEKLKALSQKMKSYQKNPEIIFKGLMISTICPLINPQSEFDLVKLPSDPLIGKHYSALLSAILSAS